MDGWGSSPGHVHSACYMGGELGGSSALSSGKWSCNGIDVRRSMRSGSMRYQLDPAGAAGSMCRQVHENRVGPR